MPTVWIAFLPALLAAQPEAPSLREFLERRLEVDEKEWQAIQAGQPVAKLRTAPTTS